MLTLHVGRSEVSRYNIGTESQGGHKIADVQTLTLGVKLACNKINEEGINIILG